MDLNLTETAVHRVAILAALIIKYKLIKCQTTEDILKVPGHELIHLF